MVVANGMASQATGRPAGVAVAAPSNDFVFPPVSQAIIDVSSLRVVAKAGPGFYNLGNTCFLNSILQVAPLVHCPTVRVRLPPRLHQMCMGLQ